jgi:transcription-repair coupling factor (superfamily II helicase)
LKNLVNLYTLNKKKLISSVEASLLPLWQRNEFPSFGISKGLNIDRDIIVQNLQDLGYYILPIVTKEGEMSARGGILDVFPPDKENPVRIEFFGDEIESIRFFDIETQLSIKEINDIKISPAVEPEEGQNLIELFSEGKILLNAPDDIKRHYPEVDRIVQDKKPVKLTSLQLKTEGFDFAISSNAGYGLLREERKTTEDFIIRVNELKRKYFILMVCSSESQAKRLKELFFDQNTDVPVFKRSITVRQTHGPVITTGELSRGFVYQDIIILTEKDIFGKRPVFKSIKKSRVSKLISSIEDFKEGDYLVHIEHGIGKFMGIKKEKIEDYEDDFITIEYLGGDKLFVPLERINYVQKYHAPENIRPRLDKLGGKTWQKTKQKVKQKIKDMAEKLISIYARRTASSGHAFSSDTELHREFDGFFAYEETPDQLTSINEIKRDMEKPTSMDRLLCGDVGYGKTEVIMRACFKAVYDSKQVAVLVPTTILAEQHYDTFTSRFSAFPINIDYLSRFKTRAEQKQTLDALEKGEIDIIIGTHRLLGNH